MEERRNRVSEGKRTITADDIYRRKAASISNSNTPEIEDETQLERDLNAQTPTRRRSVKKSSTEDPGTSRRQSHVKKYKVKENDTPKKKQKSRKKDGRASPFLVQLILVCTVYALILPISILVIYVLLPHHSTPETKDFVYSVGSLGKEHSTRICSSDTIYFRDVYYADMTTIADYYGLTTTGDNEIRKFTVRSSSEQALFRIGQSSCRVNGVELSMEAPCRELDGRVYVPVNFINRCFDGIEVKVDEQKSRISVTRLTDKTGKDLPITMAYKEVTEASPIKFENLDKDLQQYIIKLSEPEEPEPLPDGEVLPTVGNTQQI